ncbi:MAG: hypothetical protein ACREF3_14335 [Acetobacteraceae bacterium]
MVRIIAPERPWVNLLGDAAFFVRPVHRSRQPARRGSLIAQPMLLRSSRSYTTFIGHDQSVR